MPLRIILGNDHGGVDVKPAILKHLADKDHRVTNIGTDTAEIVRYPHYARQVAMGVASGQFDRGILICSTGIGMSIAANRFPGVRASLCTSTYMAKMTRRHNDSNVLCLGGRITGIFEILDILEAWLENEFEGGRHEISLGLIRDLDDEVIQRPAGPSDGAESTP